MMVLTLLLIGYTLPSVISGGKRALAIKDTRKPQNDDNGASSPPELVGNGKHTVVSDSSPSPQPATKPLPLSFVFTLPPFLTPSLTLPPISPYLTLPPALSPQIISSYAPRIAPIIAPVIVAHLPTLNPAIPPILAPFFNSLTFPPDISILTLPPALSPQLISSFGPAIPSIIASYGPAIEPSLNSFSPGIMGLLPTRSPFATIEPSPSGLASTSPTHHPTTTYWPSLVPSAVIVAAPTHRPTTAPTLTDMSIAYGVTQTFSGITTSIYNQASTINNGVVARTVSTYITQITNSDVSVNSVTSVTVSQQQRRFLRANLLQSTSASAIILGYTISIPSITAAGFATSSSAYSTTSSELLVAIRSGAFNQTMHDFALLTPGCTLVGAHAGNATFSNYTQTAVVNRGGSSSSSGSSAGSGFIAGIVTAVAVGVALLTLAVLYILRNRAKRREGRLSNESTASSVKAERAQQAASASVIENPIAPPKPSAPPPKPVFPAKRSAKDTFGTVRDDDEEDGPAFFMRDSVLDGFDDGGL